jgi:Lrp/AsnC family transcriptional regulator, regulator for asnA, asnC and gidA
MATNDFSGINLDNLDRALIGQLQRYGRASLLSLASKLGVSHGTIRSRLNRLLGTQTLSVVGIVDPWKVGFPTLALIGIRADLKRFAQIGEALVTLEELTTVAATTGRYDFVVWGNFRDDRHLLDFLSEKLSKVTGITSTETYHILSLQKRIWQWDIPVARNGFPLNRRRRGVRNVAKGPRKRL